MNENFEPQCGIKGHNGEECGRDATALCAVCNVSMCANHDSKKPRPAWHVGPIQYAEEPRCVFCEIAELAGRFDSGRLIMADLKTWVSVVATSAGKQEAVPTIEALFAVMGAARKALWKLYKADPESAKAMRHMVCPMGRINDPSMWNAFDALDEKLRRKCSCGRPDCRYDDFWAKENAAAAKAAAQ